MKEGVDGNDIFGVADLQLSNGEDWNVRLLHDLCDDGIVKAITKVQWTCSHACDRLLLKGHNDGGFTMRDCYHVAIVDRLSHSSNIIWRTLWRVNLHKRLRVHFWCIFVRVLPTKEHFILSFLWKINFV